MDDGRITEHQIVMERRVFEKSLAFFVEVALRRSMGIKSVWPQNFRGILTLDADDGSVATAGWNRFSTPLHSVTLAARSRVSSAFATVKRGSFHVVGFTI